MSNVGYSTLTVIPSAKGFASKLGGEVNGPMGSTGKKGGKLLGAGLVAAAAKFAAPLAAAIGVGKVIATGFAEAADAARINAQLAAGIASTGNAANVSVAGLNKYAGALQLSTGQTDDSIAGAQALLLTFTNIKNVGPDKIFDQATLAAANMAARLGGDAAGQAKVLGKALNDPVAGITALSRAGVQFTDAQKTQISTMVEAGDTLGAQKIILAELETQFGGSAEAAGKTFPGQIEILKRSFEDFSQMLVGRFGPSLATGIGFLSSGIQAATPVVDGFLTGLGQKFGSAKDVVVGAFSGVGSEATAAATMDLGPAAAPLTQFGEAVRGVFDSVITAVAPFVPQIVSAFSALGPQVLAILPMLSPLGLIFKALLPVFPQLASAVAQLAAALGPLLGAVIAGLTPILGAVVNLLSGVFVAIMPTVISLVSTLAAAFGPIAEVIAAVLAAVLPLVTAILGQLLPVLTTLIGAILPPLAQLFGTLVGAIAPLISTIAGLLIPVIQALMPVITTVFGVVVAIVTSAMQIVQGIIDVVTGVITGNWSLVWTGIQGILSGIWNTIVAVVQGAIGIVASVIQAVLGAISGVWNVIWSGIGSFLSDIWNKAVTVVRVAIMLVQSVIQSVLNTIRGVWNGLWSGLGSFLSNAFNGYVNFVRGGIQNVLGFFSSLPGNIMGFLSGLPNMLITAGRNMIEGFINGIKDVASGIAEAVLAPIRDAVSGVENFLGINSPSRLFMEIGGFTGEGMAIGLQKSAGLIRKASDALIPTAPSFTAPTVAAGGIAGALAARPDAGGEGGLVIKGDVYTQDLDEFGRKVERGQRRARMAYSTKVVMP